MLQRVASIEGCRLLATDGEIGSIEDVYFDDERWVVRYLVIDTGGWLTGRDVLISPYAVKLVDLAARTVAVDLTREKVRLSPDISTKGPLSRQREAEYYRYYGYPAYWPFMTYWPAGAFPTVPQPDPLQAAEERAKREEHARQREQSDPADFHLRSSSEVAGYRIQATDNGIGHVEDFLFDDETWAIRYLVIDTRKWLPGRRVLVSSQWIREVDWGQGTVKVDRSREQIRQAPEFDPDHLPAGDHERAPQQVHR